MDHLPPHILAVVITHLDDKSCMSLASTSSKFSSKNIIWETLFNNCAVAKDIKGKFTFKDIELEKSPKWYIPNKSYIKLYLLAKEIERRDAKLQDVPSAISASPVFISDEKGNEYFYIVTPSGDVVELFVYEETYENTYLWIQLSHINGKRLFLPLMYLMYQHGGGWFGFKYPALISFTKTFLGVGNLENNNFLHQLAKHMPCLDSGYVWGSSKWEKETRVKPLDLNIDVEKVTRADFGNFWGLMDLNFLEENSLRVYEERQKVRDEEYRRKKRGPVSEEELVIWEKFMWKADRGHKDGQFAAEWNELFAKVKTFSEDHLRYLVQNVPSDLGRNILWCSASRGWVNECKWALSYGADPDKEGGKGTPRHIATQHKREPVLDLFNNK